MRNLFADKKTKQFPFKSDDVLILSKKILKRRKDFFIELSDWLPEKNKERTLIIVQGYFSGVRQVFIADELGISTSLVGKTIADVKPFIMNFFEPTDD